MSWPRSIVVGVDFTACSATAIRQAVRLAELVRASIHSVHVIEKLVVTDLEEALSPVQADVRAALVRDVRKAWPDFTANIPGASALELAVEIDNPVAAILRLVRERSAELLVLGTHGTSSPDRGVGALATACVRKASSSVLLVRESQVGPFRSVIACVDFSDTSRKALEQAARMAVRDGAALHVLHVFDAPWHRLHYRAPTPQASADYQKQYRDALRRRLQAFAESVAPETAPLTARYELFDYNGYAAGISEFVKQVDGDLVVLGTRGRTNLRDILLGSTAERVIRDTPCSVLAVKPEGFEHLLGR
jgi:nucleotide-binding universal stress UspA family protein